MTEGEPTVRLDPPTSTTADGAAPPASDAPAPAAARPTGSRVASAVREIVNTIVLAALLLFAVKAAVQNFHVEGASMEPNFHDGEYLLVNRVGYFRLDNLPIIGPTLAGGESPKYIFAPPQRGDVIVFRYPGGPEDYIKRVIGLPGETVEIHDGKVFINGLLLDEPYIKLPPRYTYRARQVPPGQYFVLGDNRPNSSDSHVGWFVPADNIIGKAVIVYWPPTQWGLVPDESPELTPAGAQKAA